MSYSAGEAYLQVVPSFRGAVESITAETRKWGDVGGKSFTDGFNRAVRGATDVAVGPTRAASARQGSDAAGSFAEGFRARVTAALRDLPKPNVGVNATELDAELADIRARMQALADAHVGVDLDAGAAMSELTALRARLDELGARSPDIQVKVDAAAASTELAAIQAEVNKLNGSSATVDVNDHGTIGAGVTGLSSLATAGIALGPAIIPAAAAAAAAIAGIGAGALAALGGIGVVAIALSGITKAVQELTQQHAQAGAVAARSAAQQVSSAAAIANAEQGVADARRGVGDAERQLADARRGVADAERSSTQQVQAALQRQQDAETSLAAAQRAARQAQLDLTAARKAAKQDLEDLTLQVQDGALAQRQAILDVQDAQANLNKTLADPTATALQRQQAQLSYDQAVQQLTDINVRQTRLVDQQKAASKAGVDGAAGVVAAQQKVTDSHNAVLKAQRGVKDATAGVTEAQRAGAEQIAKAQEQVVAGNERVIAAQQRVVAADRALEVAHAQAASAAVAGTAKTLKAYNELPPAGQRFAQFIVSTLVPAFDKIRSAAQAGLLPGLMAGFQALAPALPAITSLVGSLATTMGNLFEQGAEALTAPFWQQFFGFLGSTMGPNLTIFVHIVENVAKGFAGLFQAFAPVATQIGNALLHLSGAFASFGAGAGSNVQFQRFLAYIQEVGPQVAHTVGAIVSALAHVAVALAPLGGIGLTALKEFSDTVSAIPAPVLTAVAVGIAAVVVGIKAWAVAQAILNGVMLIFDTLAAPELLLLAGAGVTILAVVAAVVALTVGIVELVKHWSTVWAAMKEAASAAWRDAIHPALSGILTAAKAIGAFFSGPFVGFFTGAWKAVRDAASGAASKITGKFDDVVGFFTKMPGRISRAASGMWDGIKNGFRDVLNDIIRWWNGLDFHVPGFHHLGVNVNGFDLGMPDIPLIGARAAGGPVGPGGAYIVGEKGPELMQFGAPGTVYPSDATAQLLAGLSGGSRPAVGAGTLAAMADSAAQPSSRHYEVHMHNPRPERSSTDIPRAIRRADFEAGYLG